MTVAAEEVAALHKRQSLADDTQQRATQAGAALDRIVDGVSLLNEPNLVIARAAEQPAPVAREGNRNLVNIQELSRLATSFNNPGRAIPLLMTAWKEPTYGSSHRCFSRP